MDIKLQVPPYKCSSVKRSNMLRPSGIFTLHQHTQGALHKLQHHSQSTKSHKFNTILFSLDKPSSPQPNKTSVAAQPFDCPDPQLQPLRPRPSAPDALNPWAPISGCPCQKSLVSARVQLCPRPCPNEAWIRSNNIGFCAMNTASMMASLSTLSPFLSQVHNGSATHTHNNNVLRPRRSQKSAHPKSANNPSTPSADRKGKAKKKQGRG